MLKIIYRYIKYLTNVGTSIFPKVILNNIFFIKTFVVTLLSYQQVINKKH